MNVYKIVVLVTLISASVQAEQVTIETKYNPQYFETEKQIAIKSFSKCYSSYCPVSHLKLSETYTSQGDNAKKAWLTDTFDEEAADLKNDTEGKITLVKVTDESGAVIGWATYEYSDADKHTIYLRQVAVQVDHQRNGIGTQILDYILKQNPRANQLSVVVRVINKQAQNFYTKNGFSENKAYVHAGYSTERYTGYTKTIEAITKS